jgi:hypothetical protein
MLRDAKTVQQIVAAVNTVVSEEETVTRTKPVLVAMNLIPSPEAS